MSKKEKKDELELILEKLKESYGDNTSSEDELLSDSSDDEKDEELSSMLTKIFFQMSENNGESKKREKTSSKSDRSDNDTKHKEAVKETIRKTTEESVEKPKKPKATRRTSAIKTDNSEKIEFRVKSDKKRSAPIQEAVNTSASDAFDEALDSIIVDNTVDDSSVAVFTSSESSEYVSDKNDDQIVPTLEHDAASDLKATPEVKPVMSSETFSETVTQANTKRLSREEDEQVENVIRLMFANRGRSSSHDEKITGSKDEQAVESIGTQLDEIADGVDSVTDENNDSSVYFEYAYRTDGSDYSSGSSFAFNNNDMDYGIALVVDREVENAESDEQHPIYDGSEHGEEKALLDESQDLIEDTVSEKITYIRVDDPLQGHLSDGDPGIKSDHIHKSEVVKNTVAQKSREDIDNDDISLLLKLGYDEEIKSEAGKERTDGVKQEMARAFMPEKDNVPFGFCGKEFCEAEQIPEIRKKYSNDKKKLIIRIAGVSVISLILLFLNLTYYFGPENTVYKAFPFFEMILMLGACCFTFYGLRAGLKGILRIEPNVYSVSFFAVTVFYVYSIVATIVSAISSDGTKVELFGFIAALYLLSSLLSKLADCSRESVSFNTLTASDDIYTAEAFDEDFDEESKRNREIGNFTEKGKNIREKVFRIRKTSLISGYFRRTSAKTDDYSKLFYLFAIIPPIALIVGCISLILGNSLIDAMTAMTFSIFMGMPLTVVLIISIPSYNASKRLSKHGCAIIGTASAEEYAKTRSLIFEDTNAIKINKGIEIHPENLTDLKKSVKIIARVFSALGGPLSELLGQTDAMDEGAAPPDISISSVQDSGIELYMDSSVHVIIGDKSFLSHYNIKVSNDSSVNASVNSKFNSILYIALDGIPKLGYIVENKVRDEFIRTASMLEKNNISTIIKTYDPELNNFYFEQTKTSDMPVISVYKPCDYEDPARSAVTDSGIVAVGDCKKIAHTVIRCREMLKRRKAHRRYCALLSTLGILIAVAVFILSAIFGDVFLLEYRTVILLVFQLLGTIPILTGRSDDLGAD